MIRMSESVHVKTLPISGKFALTAPFHFFHNDTGAQVIEVGFVTDFASIPRLFRSLFSVNGRHREAACVHDWLYQRKGRLSHRNLSRKQCDAIFFDGLKHEKIGFFKRHAMHKAVRLFGGLHLRMSGSGGWDTHKVCNL